MFRLAATNCDITLEQWTPISFDELYELIIQFENQATGDLQNFWELIKIEPEKWQEAIYGPEGGGFWAVAVCGRRIIWYNDIEDGFNISTYKEYGTFSDYWCNQDWLLQSVQRLYDLIHFGGDIGGYKSGPHPVQLP